MRHEGNLEIGDIKELLNKLSSHMRKERKVKKSIPAKAEWKKAVDELRLMHRRVKSDMGKMHTLRDKMWADIAIDMNDYASEKRWSKDENAIEIMCAEDEDDVEEKLIKSPFT